MAVDIVASAPHPPLSGGTDGVHATHNANGDHASHNGSANGATSTESNGVKKATTATTLTHPLGPLTAAEISQASAAIRAAWPEGTLFQFKVITLVEPPKMQMVDFLDAEHKGLAPAAIDRRAFVLYYIRNTVRVQKALLRSARSLSLNRTSCMKRW
jgi:Cu2+-containing amine oxidase